MIVTAGTDDRPTAAEVRSPAPCSTACPWRGRSCAARRPARGRALALLDRVQRLAAARVQAPRGEPVCASLTPC